MHIGPHTNHTDTAIADNGIQSSRTLAGLPHDDDLVVHETAGQELTAILSPQFMMDREVTGHLNFAVTEARQIIIQLSEQRDELLQRINLLEEHGADLEYNIIVARRQSEEADKSRRVAEETSQYLTEEVKMLRDETRQLAQALTTMMMMQRDEPSGSTETVD